MNEAVKLLQSIDFVQWSLLPCAVILLLVWKQLRNVWPR